MTNLLARMALNGCLVGALSAAMSVCGQYLRPTLISKGLSPGLSASKTLIITTWAAFTTSGVVIGHVTVIAAAD